EVLPALLVALGVDAVREPPWLFGHSDGATIALLMAAAPPQAVAGIVALAPHTHVEAVALQSIAQARDAYLQTDLREKLARHHDEPDSAFWGWNDVWLSADFQHWTIEREIEAIRCPLLAIQGIDDEYGTLVQIHGVARRLPQTELLELADCGHSAHRDQPEAVVAATVDFMQRHRR
ncbi:MAG: alpha/beta hydrolase, partial [Burkholderiaceae bacterium]